MRHATPAYVALCLTGSGEGRSAARFCIGMSIRGGYEDGVWNGERMRAVYGVFRWGFCGLGDVYQGVFVFSCREWKMVGGRGPVGNVRD